MDPKEALWRQSLSHAGILRFRPLGCSMAPILCNGDIVTIEARADMRVGDIMLADHGGGLVLHRVVARRNGRLITKGDSLDHLDAPVTREQILGRAVARERQGRRSSLVSYGARFCGLCFSLTFPWVDRFFPPGVTVLKRLFRGGLLSEPEYASISGQD